MTFPEFETRGGYNFGEEEEVSDEDDTADYRVVDRNQPDKVPITDDASKQPVINQGRVEEGHDYDSEAEGTETGAIPIFDV